VKELLALWDGDFVSLRGLLHLPLAHHLKDTRVDQSLHLLRQDSNYPGAYLPAVGGATPGEEPSRIPLQEQNDSAFRFGRTYMAEPRAHQLRRKMCVRRL